MSEATRVVIVHGSYGAPEGNWFPWLASELRKDGHYVVVPKFPTPVGQNFKNWREVFRTEVGPLKPNVILVGHSAGPGFILKMLQDSDEPVRGTFLVAGFLGELGLEDFDPINEALFGGEFAWDRIRENAGFVRIYNSDDDPYVPLDKGREIARHLGVELNIIEGGGHLNSSAGYDEFPRLLEDLRALLADANDD